MGNIIGLFIVALFALTGCASSPVVSSQPVLQVQERETLYLVNESAEAVKVYVGFQRIGFVEAKRAACLRLPPGRTSYQLRLVTFGGRDTIEVDDLPVNKSQSWQWTVTDHLHASVQRIVPSESCLNVRE